ncbi:MAG: hypothetical protein R2860_13795 [Desulfobacterales bacterium]
MLRFFESLRLDLGADLEVLKTTSKHFLKKGCGLLKNFERLIIFALIVMMVLVVFISTIELAVLIIKDIIEPPEYWLGIDQLFEISDFS